MITQGPSKAAAMKDITQLGIAFSVYKRRLQIAEARG